MDGIYEWLYDEYVLPQMQDIAKGQNEILDRLAGALSLSKTGRRCLHDVTGNMRIQWGTEAFVLGVRMGLELVGPRVRETDSAWLSYLLAQLNDPVT